MEEQETYSILFKICDYLSKMRLNGQNGCSDALQPLAGAELQSVLP